MKTCPKCRSQYTDESLTYCLQDGTPLVDASADEGEPTVAFGDAETLESRKGEGRIGIEIPRDDDGPETQLRAPARATATEPASRSGLLRTTLFAAAILFTLFLIAGTIGLVIYFNMDGGGAVSNTDGRLPSNIDIGSNADNGASPSPTPEPTETPEAKPSPSPTEEESPTPEYITDPDEVKDFVRRHLQIWKRLTEQQRLDELMSFYDERLERYYSKSNVAKSVVRRDKAAAFAKLDSLSITISKLDVTPSEDGARAVAVFDKEWRFVGNGRVSTGKVRSRFDLRRSGDSWLITGERDLKVYYTR
ncbi:MAG: hypothetical protein IPM63_15530 [Acidobacteriota bacterium]|nr:MAG: hypothetical protein IPM63_15530 [Acidobacteriota bacterium]